MVKLLRALDLHNTKMYAFKHSGYVLKLIQLQVQYLLNLSISWRRMHQELPDHDYRFSTC